MLIQGVAAPADNKQVLSNAVSLLKMQKSTGK